MSIEQNVERMAVALEMLVVLMRRALSEIDKTAVAEVAQSEAPEPKSTKPGRKTKSAAKELTENDVRDAAAKLVKEFPNDKLGFLTAQNVVKEFEVEKISQLVPRQYAGVIEALTAAHAELKIKASTTL